MGEGVGAARRVREVADKVAEAYEQAKASDVSMVPDELADSAVYHCHPSLEHVLTWVSQAGLAVEEKGTGKGHRRMATYRDQLANLMDLASGDEKHDPSAYSTLEVLWVLYDRVLNYDVSNPQSEDRDRFIMSKGHGPLVLYAILAQKGFFPASELERFLEWEVILGGHRDR